MSKLLKTTNKNNKIKNATTKIYNNITFRSNSEVTMYKLLESAQLNFEYEPEKFILYPSAKHTGIDVLLPEKNPKGVKIPNKDRSLVVTTDTFRAITYTPDFIITKGNNIIYVDVKGYCNDTYPIKMKMFLGYLTEKETISGKHCIFAEPHTKKQMLQLIEFINNLN